MGNFLKCYNSKSLDYDELGKQTVEGNKMYTLTCNTSSQHSSTGKVLKYSLHYII